MLAETAALLSALVTLALQPRCKPLNQEPALAWAVSVGSMQLQRSLPLLCVVAFASGAYAQSDPATWNSTATYPAGAVVKGSNGDWYRCLYTSLSHDPTKDGGGYWELYYAPKPLILSVATSGGQFPSIQKAWNFIIHATIPPDSSITMSIRTNLSAFADNLDAPFSLNHRCGAQVFSRGDNASKIELKFPSGENGFYLTDGHAFGGINGVTIDGTSASAASIGIWLNGNSTMGYSQVWIRHFMTGIQTELNSSMTCDQSNISGFGWYGINAQEHSTVHALGVTVDAGGSTGVCIVASNGSSIDAGYSSSSNSKTYAYYATSGGTILAPSSKASNSFRGYMADSHGTIMADGSKASGNTNGFVAGAGGFISAGSVSNVGNGLNFAPTLNTPGPDLGLISG